MQMQNVVESLNSGAGGQSGNDLGMQSFSSKEMVSHNRAKKPTEQTDFGDMGCKGSFKRRRCFGVQNLFAPSKNKGIDTSKKADIGSLRSFIVQEMVNRDRAEKPKEHTAFRNMGCNGSFNPRCCSCLTMMGACK